jgi:hypothetical protein
MKIDSRFEMVSEANVYRAIRFLGIRTNQKLSRKLFRLFYNKVKDEASRKERRIRSDKAISIFFGKSFTEIQATERE